MQNCQYSLGFFKVTNNYNKLTEKQKINLELLNNKETILKYFNIKNNYKYWSTQRIDKEININLKTQNNETN